VEEIVNQGRGLERWVEGGEASLRERQTALRDFRDRIQKPPAAPRARTSRKEFPPVFQPGTCLSVKLANGDFGAALVTGADQERKEGKNLVAILEYRSKVKPAMRVFEEREWLRTKSGGFFRGKEVLWLFASGFEDAADIFEKVGTVELSWVDPGDSTRSSPSWSIVPRIIEKAMAAAV
jgi:hypothetical protein